MTTDNEKHTPLLMYPTLIIGLGGTGKNVVRHVKRRLLRTWNTQGNQQLTDTDLPSLLQTLVVDTEPLSNGVGEQPLYDHEYVFAGKFDATKLVYNKENHPYLDWWLWDEKMIQPGYIHNGAKQLRPIGRLAFHRHFVSIRNSLKTKLDSLGVTSDHLRAQERGFSTMDNFKLIYIVSSLCGGTGAGMFLDMAHLVRSMVGSSASVIGVFMMPSVFEQQVRADIQKRRIHANAYAALREIDHFHTTQSFKQLYQGQSKPIPEVPRRAFSQIFLVERTNSNGFSITDKSTAEQMSAHMISLTVFSHMTQDILGFDVNVTEERTGGHGSAYQQSGDDTDVQRKFLSYSSFGTSAIVLPKNRLWDHFRHTMVVRSLHSYFTPPESELSAAAIQNLAVQIQKNLYDIDDRSAKPTVATLTAAANRLNAFQSTNAMNPVIQELIDGLLTDTLTRHGISAYVQLLDSLLAPGSSLDQIRPTEEQQQRLEPATGVVANVGNVFSGLYGLFQSTSRNGDQTRRLTLAQNQLAEVRIRVRKTLFEAINAYISELKVRLDSVMNDSESVYQTAMADLEQSRAGFHGLLSNSDDESVKTIYENESNAIGTNEVNDFIDLVIQRVESYTDPEGGENLSAAITSSLNQCVLNGDGTLQDNLVQTIQAYRDIVMTFFDIRFITTIQDGDPRPSNHRTDQMMRRSAPAINVDGDIAEHSEMDMENTRLYSNPTRVDQAVATVFNAEMRRHPFSPVKTPYADRIDVIHITHGLPVTQLVGIEELRNQYFHPDFDPRLLHLDPRWYFDTNNLTAGEQRLIRERNLTRHTAWAPSPWQTTTTPATPATPDRMPPRNPNSGI